MKMAAGGVGQTVQGVSQDSPWRRRLETCQVSTGDQDPALPLCNNNKKKKSDGHPPRLTRQGNIQKIYSCCEGAAKDGKSVAAALYNPSYLHSMSEERNSWKRKGLWWV